MDPNIQNQPSPSAPAADNTPPQQPVQNLNQQAAQPQAQTPPQEPPKSSKKLLILAVLLIGIVLIVVGGIVAYSMLSGSDDNSENLSSQSMSNSKEATANTEKVVVTNEIPGWTTYADTDNQFSLQYPSEYFIKPQNLSKDFKCIFIMDTEEFGKNTRYINACYNSKDVSDVLPEVLEDDIYEKLTINGNTVYKNSGNGVGLREYKYVVLNNPTGYMTFDNATKEEVLDQVISTVTFN